MNTGRLRRDFLLGTVSAAAVGLSTRAALAHPVRIGRYEEIPYGISTEHPYPTAGGNPGRSGRVRVTASHSGLTRQWTADLRTGRPSAPAVSEEGRLFVASSTGVSALGPDGSILWVARVGFGTGTPSFTPGGSLVVTTHTGSLAWIDPEGVVRHRASGGASFRGSPLVLHDGSVVVAATDPALVRYDASGREIFRMPVNAQWMGPPCLTARGEIWAPSGDRLLRMSTSGTLLGEVTAAAPITSGPAVSLSGAWLLDQSTILTQVDLSGAVLTQTRTEQPATGLSTLAVASDGSVRVPTRGGVLLAYGSGGGERWRIEDEGNFFGGATLDSEDFTLIVNDQGVLLIIDPEGSVVSRTRTDLRSDSAPVVGADGTVFVVGMRGVVHAWR